MTLISIVVVGADGAVALRTEPVGFNSKAVSTDSQAESLGNDTLAGIILQNSAQASSAQAGHKAHLVYTPRDHKLASEGSAFSSH